MSEGLNKVLLLGNLGADPELNYTQQNTAVLKMRLATSSTYLDRDRQRQERTEWHTVIVWGKRGEALGRILTKGSRIMVEGELRTRSWDAQDGTKRYATEVVASNVLLNGGGTRSSGAASSPRDDDYRAGDYSPPAGGDDDIPF